MSAIHRLVIFGVVLFMLPAGASAQGFFESLFGFGSGGQRHSQPAIRQSASPATDLRYREPVARPATPYGQDGPATMPGGKYRTLCVRMCDGYYFPISGSVTRNGFYRDAQICRRSCGSEAKLFYHASSSGDASKMVDLSGLPYSRLPNAFRYRKQFVSDCKCRPEPWSTSEIARHQRYAATALLTEPRPDPVTEIASGPTAEHGDPEANEQQPEASSPAPNGDRAPTIDQAPTPVVRPTPAPSPRSTPGSRMRAASPVAEARMTPQARPKPTMANSNSTGFLGFTFGGSSQKKLRWPGD